MSTTEIVTEIIEELVASSRQKWKNIIEDKSDSPFIGIKQTIARALYEGKLDDTMKILLQLKMAEGSRPSRGGR